MRVGGHFFFRAAIEHGHAFSAKAPRHGGAVNRGVTGADNDYVAADVQLRRLKFAAFDVFESIEYVLFSRNSQLRGITKAHADKYGVKILLQVGHSGIDARFL